MASTYSAQDDLPRLPVPDLPTTITRLLETAEPLTTPAELEQLRAQAAQLLSPSGMGSVLQKRLLDRAAAKQDKSWLIEWWNSIMYLAWRLPVAINVSYFYQFKDDPDRSRMTQVARAASLISGCMEFRDLLVSERLPAESVRGGAKLCMQMYRFMFNACRRPAPVEDITATHPHSNTRVLVIRKNRFFTFDIGEPGSTRSTVEEIEEQLRRIIAAAGTEADPVPVGAITSAHRDDLANYYEHLVNAHPVNRTALREIEASAFAVCLDDSAPTDHVSQTRGLLHGDGMNRWYDKNLQFIVCENGKAGFMGEHSAMDGSPTSHMINWVLHGIANGKLAKRTGAAPRAIPTPDKLTFYVSDAVAADVKAAVTAHCAAAADHEVGTLVYENYGKDLVKKFKMSPDAYAQMAIQLAYYSMYGAVRGTYEPAQTRAFLCGRTECIRTVSSESKAWVEAMRNAKSNPVERTELLRAAINKHVTRSKLASRGEGVDRHLFGLRMLRNAGEKCALFENPVFSRIATWYISTSNLTSEYFSNWGWGEVVPQGIGVAYSTQKDAFRFNVVSRLGVGGVQYCAVLRRVLDEMRDTVTAATTPMRSRL